MSSGTAAVDLASPDAFVDGAPHEALADLRRTDPVHWQPMAGEPGFWAVLRHADVAHVARHTEIFSASEGGVVVEDMGPEILAMMRNMLLAMDPPVHTKHRAPLVAAFPGPGDRRDRGSGARNLPGHHGRSVGARRSRVRPPGRLAATDAGDRRAVRPATADWDHIHELAERNTSIQDPDIADAGAEDATHGDGDVRDRARGQRRRAGDRTDDLTSAILEADFGGQPMSDIEFGSFFVQLVTAGNDTTKGMLGSGLLTLLTHPDQLAELRADRSLIPGAVEEIIRYANPLHYFRRTALADVELAGTRIAAGDKVAMYYTSANRDEDVFREPQTFDIHRHPNPHLSFGIGSHFCLGVHLARLEGRVFFEELLDSFATIELTGDPVRVRSNLNNTLKRLPVRLSA